MARKRTSHSPQFKAKVALEAAREQYTATAPATRTYLLRQRVIDRPDLVWASDITYLPLRHGFVYLVAVMDWFSRYVLSWRLANTLDTAFCLEALDEALTRGRPEISNTDQDRNSPAARSRGGSRRPGCA